MRRLLGLLVWPFSTLAANLTLWTLFGSRHLLSSRLAARIEDGAVFEVVAPLETTLLTHWHAAFTDGFPCVLPVGVRLRAHGGAPPGARSCVFVPGDPPDFMERFVPRETRGAPKFAGVSVPLSPRQIETHLAPVEPGAIRRRGRLPTSPEADSGGA